MRLRGGRASEEDVRNKLLPALYDALASGGHGQFNPRAMLAVAKSARGEGHAKASGLMQNFLKMKYAQEDRLAALSLGVLEFDAAYPLLNGLAFDTADGRQLNSGQKVKGEVRAFAAYGLGLHGRASSDRARKQQVVGDLVLLLEDDEAAGDIRIAAMMSLGLIPLPIQKGAVACVCGVCEVEGPETSLQAQVTYLMRYFTARDEFDAPLRAHAATALARLLEDQSEEDMWPIKEAVAGLLIDAVAPRSREPQMVRESCVLALGLLGDADLDPTDQWIRWALSRAVASSYLERRFALVSLGLVGSRGGRGESPFGGTEEVRRSLMHHLASTRKDLRPWAALGLGALGHWLRAAGEPTSNTVDFALRAAARRSRRASDLGAYAIASGMRRDSGATETLLQKTKKARDDAARAYAVIGVGMIGDRQAVQPLEALLAEGRRHPGLTESLGVALGLLGDHGVVNGLANRLASAETDDERSAYVAALGGIGDTRSIEVIVEALRDAKYSSPVREAAAVALGRIGDRKALPWRTAFVPGTNYHSAPESLTNAERTGVLDMP